MNKPFFYYWLFVHGQEKPLLSFFPEKPGDHWPASLFVNVMGPFPSKELAEAWASGGEAGEAFLQPIGNHAASSPQSDQPGKLGPRANNST